MNAIHLLATVGNIALMLVLMRRKGWESWPWVFWAQAVSIVLMAAHNWQLHHVDPMTFKRWWQTFDIANVILEMVYLWDLRECCPITFSVFAGIGAETFIEYFIAEAGNVPMANQMLIVRVCCDAFAVLMLTYVVYATPKEKRDARRRTLQRP